ncbi:uncharacterized protein LOC127861675 [Dreissena polymorpha]|uniref:uncharacterized protein LOC127861675 n=1 Tax=Dreissena polymorpha TaxID=45954 RepID=UPI00226440E2|nr:uncharacterized protein LOC127861675 [Dreissena polymorpha]
MQWHATDAVSVHVCKSASVATIIDRCYVSNQTLCHSNQATEQQTTKLICHNNVACSWCEIVDLLCANKLEATHIRVTTNPACNTTLQVLGSQQRIALTTTHSPAYFETHFFAAAQHGIDDLLYSANRSGATVDEMKKIYSKQDHAQKSYVRNTKCWAYPLDLTSISPWNSNGGIRKAGVLISPRHALWVRHYSMSVNTITQVGKAISMYNSILHTLYITSLGKRTSITLFNI